MIQAQFASRSLLFWILAIILPGGSGLCKARSGVEAQELLDRGEDLALNPGEVIEITETLRVRHAGQRIYTTGAKTVSDFGIIRQSRGSSGTLLEGYGIEGLAISDVIFDGNRSSFQSPEGKLEYVPMISLGGEGSDGQNIRRCIVLNSRSAGGWGAIHIQEGGRNILVEDNIVFASGVDIRGNGRSNWEKPFGWGDGISTASRNTLIRNNLIYDATDEGVMVQGGPGSKVIDNVIVSVSREMLGGIALIDPFAYHQMGPAENKRFDYRDVIVEDNWIIAMGGRIHAGLPMGGDAWHPNLGGTILYGATVRNNLISGKAGGYGYVANGIDGFVVKGNRSNAIYSGLGDGLPNNPPDEPSAFLYNPAATGNSDLQPDFLPAKRHVTKVLRSNRGSNIPSDLLGYRDIGYPMEEAEAVVETAYLEMLGRNPTVEEKTHWTNWLRSTHSNADRLRSILITTEEFIERSGYINPLELHEWRGDRWLELIAACCTKLQKKNEGKWPSARALHHSLVKSLQFINPQ